MTIEELKEALASEEGAELLAELGYKSAEDVKGLENKRTELIIEAKKNKAGARALRELLEKAGVDSVEAILERLESSVPNDEAESKLSKIQKQLDLLTKEATSAKETAAKERAKRTESEKRQRIRAALEKSGIDGDVIDILLPSWERRAIIEEDEDGKIAVLVDDDEGQSPIESAVGAWSKTDQAKRFIKATPNRGGGSGGPGGKGGRSLTLDEIEKLPTREERLAALKKLQDES